MMKIPLLRKPSSQKMGSVQSTVSYGDSEKIEVDTNENFTLKTRTVQPQTNTSIKAQDFLSEPVGEKDVIMIPGIGEACAKKLLEVQIDKAYQLVGYYLIHKKSRGDFLNFLTEIGIQSKFANQITDCIVEWVNTYIS